MSGLTDSQRAYVRSEIGSADPPSDADLDARFDALGSVSAVILEVLRARRADLMSGGMETSFTVQGFYSGTTNSVEYLKALDAEISYIIVQADAIDAGDYSGSIQVAKMVRPGWDRRRPQRWMTQR